MTAPALGAPWDAVEWSDAPSIIDLSWQGADHHIQVGVDPQGRSVIAKTPRRHVPLIPTNAPEARQAAARAGVGPEVLVHDPESSSTVELHAGEGWRVGTSFRLKNPAVQRSYALARQAFRSTDAALPARDLLGEARALADAIGEALPTGGVAETVALLPDFAEALSDGPAPTPGWMSSEVSDVLIGPDDRVMLTGGTDAGITDPLADVGATLASLVPYSLPADELVPVLWGDDHPGAVARALLWSLVADARAALISFVAHAGDLEAGYGMHGLRRGWKLSYMLGAHDIGALLVTARKGWS